MGPRVLQSAPSWPWRITRLSVVHAGRIASSPMTGIASCTRSRLPPRAQVDTTTTSWGCELVVSISAPVRPLVIMIPARPRT